MPELTDTRVLSATPDHILATLAASLARHGAFHIDRLSPTSIRLERLFVVGARQPRRPESAIVVAVPNGNGTTTVTIAGNVEPFAVMQIWSALDPNAPPIAPIQPSPFPLAAPEPAPTPPPPDPAQRRADAPPPPPPDPRLRRPDAWTPAPPVAPQPPVWVEPAPAFDAETVRATPEPVRARLRLHDGEIVEIGPEGAVIGREPRDPDQGESTRQLIVVDDQERLLSRSHLGVMVEDGKVFVVDLGSMNGSALVSPDGARRPLVAGEPTELPPGSSVCFGGCSAELVI
jgi:pSer/pThr/pTyr-binding forkhead associated (FHA) protein